MQNAHRLNNPHVSTGLIGPHDPQVPHCRVQIRYVVGKKYTHKFKDTRIKYTRLLAEI